MLKDFRWVLMPFSRSHRDNFKATILQRFPTDNSHWIDNSYKPITFVSDIMNRMATRATGLLSIAAFPFSISGFLFSQNKTPSMESYAICILIVLAVISLFRCLMISWVDLNTLHDPKLLFEFYADVMFIRAKYLFIGTAAVFSVIILLIYHVAREQIVTN